MATSRYSVEGRFRIIDEMTRPIRRIRRRMSGLTASIGSGLRQAGAFASQFKFAFLAAGAAVVGAAAGMVRALRDVVSVGMDFEQTMASAAAKFPGQIRAGSEEFKALEDAAKEVGATTEFTASQAAGGLRFLAMAGFDAQQSIAALPGLVDLATAAELDLDRASDIATDTLGAFALASEDAAEQARNLARVSDVMARTTTTANTNMEDMFEAIKMVGPVATASGASIETASAMIGELANAGVKGTMAGTALRNVFNRLQAPSAEASRILRRLGIDVADADGNMRDVYDILEDLKGSMSGMGEVARNAALKDIFGDRAVAPVNILLQSGSERLREYREQLEGAGGAAAEMAAVMRDTTQGDLNSMNSALEAMKLEIFDVVKGPLREIIQSMTEWFRANKDVISSGLSDALAWMEENTWAVKAALVLLVGVLAALAVVLAFIAVATFLALAPLLIFIAVVYLIYRAFEALWEVAAPIVEAIGEAMGRVWETVKERATAAWEFLVGLFSILREIVMTHLRPILAAFAWVVERVKELWQPIGAFLGRIWDSVSEKFKEVWDGIVSKATAIVEVLKGIWQPIGEFFSDLWQGIKDSFSEAFGAVVNGISSVVNTVRAIGRSEMAGDGTGGDGGPQVASPQERVARSVSETTSTQRAEVTIRDESGRAEVTRQPPSSSIVLDHSGGI